MKLIVMAGGLGTRLWPTSRDATPKQFEKLIEDKSLFQMNVESLLKRYKKEDIFVSTNAQYIDYVKEQTPQLLEENYIIEPAFKKDTGPASGYAMLKVAAKYPNEVVMFNVQPVVIRIPDEKYLDMIEGVEKLVKERRKLVSGGIRPTYPDVGSDYLKLGKKVDAINNLEVYEVEQYIDRLGDYQKTKDLVENNNVSTHCNHYTWYSDELIDAFKEYRPDWYEILMEMKKVIGTKDEIEKINELYSKFEAGRIELVTEKVINDGKALIVILPFKWIHISTWNDINEYYRYKDKKMHEGDIINIDSDNTFIKGKSGKVIAAIGLKDLIIVDTDDALLIARKDRTVDVKKVLEELKHRGLNHLL